MSYLAMGHNLWLHFGVDEHPFAANLIFTKGNRVLTHSHLFGGLPHSVWFLCRKVNVKGSSSLVKVACFESILDSLCGGGGRLLPFA